ncbi:unnamed protein product [Orchesella dallaii]|uniref:Odorant receptor n=1 Tax=Orchesella dallaii TaxID=48710 RepID=A0ABP1RC81_9HEXA
MISERMYTALGYVYPALATLGIIPYTWDRKERLIVRSSTSHVLIRYHFLFILEGLAYYLLMAIYFYYEKNYEFFNMCFSGFCAGFLVMQSFVIMVFYQDDAMVSGNCMVAYFKYMQRTYYPNYDSENSKRARLIDLGGLFIFLGCVFASILTCVVNCIYTNLPITLGYIFGEAPPIVRIPFGFIVPCIYIFILFLNCFSLTGTVYGYGLFVVPFLTKELRMGRANYESPPELRQPENLILAYRSLQILQQVINELVGKFIVPTQTMVTKLVVLSTYMVIKHGDTMETASMAVILTWSGMAGLFWSLTLMMGGHLHVYGERVIKSWKYHQWDNKYDKKLMGKFRKSCKPLMLNFGKAYRIRRLTVLKFIRSLSRGILRALLAL